MYFHGRFAAKKRSETDRDSETGGFIGEQGDVTTQVPAGATIHRALGFTQMLELWWRSQVGGFQGTHGQNGLQIEQVQVFFRPIRVQIGD